MPLWLDPLPEPADRVVPHTRSVRADDGARLVYQIIGDGPLDVLCMPAWLDPDGAWDDPLVTHLLRRVAGSARVIVLAVRAGADASEDELLARRVLDALVVLDAAGSEQATLLAHGPGRSMAPIFTTAHAERFTDIVTVDADERRARIDIDRFVSTLPRAPSRS